MARQRDQQGPCPSCKAPAPLEPLISTAELASILGCAKKTILNSRCRGGHELFDLGFLPMGVNSGLRWRPADVRAYIDKLAPK